MSRAVLVGLLLATLVALGLRCPELDRRPMHGDEAVHAIKFRDLWQEGKYTYDPNEYHGPSLYYLTYGWAKLTGAPDFVRFKESTLRAVPVLFGVGLVLLLFLVADGLGKWQTVCAGVLSAVSPAMVFYSRYYIHEIPLVFFVFLTIAAGWRYLGGGKVMWAVVTGIGLGLTHATKETFVFSIVAAIPALILNYWWARRIGESHTTRKWVANHAGAMIAGWLVVVVLLFSSFFTNWAGILDSVRTYIPWFKRAGGASPHIHEWYFYFQRLLWFHQGRGPVWTEGLIFVLALIGLHQALTGRDLAGAHRGFVRFVGFYTFALMGIYCLIGYKTPWCLLSFWHGMILLAGVGAIVLIRALEWKSYRYAITAILVAGAIHLGVQSVRANGDYCADPRNPYVYAHTSEDLLNLVDTVEGLAKVHPQGHDMVIQMMAPESDYWPLPWYFRDMKHLGYYDDVPPPPYADVMVISARLQAGGTSLVTPRELKDVPDLAKRLWEKADPVSSFIWGQIPDTQRSIITNSLVRASYSTDLTNALVRSLNFMISGYSIFDETRFKGVQLRSETQQLAAQKPLGDEAVRLNRMLLEDSYSGDLTRRQAGLYERKTHVMVGMTKLRTQNFLELWVNSKLMERYIQR